MLKARKINKCRSCYSKELTLILPLGNLFLAEYRKDNLKPKSYPLNLVLCNNCLLLQLRETTPSSALYTNNYGYKSGVNNTMRSELREIANKSLNEIDKAGKIVVVDIGANDGTLLSFYPKNVRKVAVEPIPKLAKEAERYSDIVVNDFFNYSSFSKKLSKEKANIITAISCFYDIDDPNRFIRDIKKILKKEGIFVIQQNYLKSMLEKKAFDNIVHEHLEYYSLTSLENLINKHGLEIFKVELSDINGGSFRTYISHKGSRPIDKSVTKLRDVELKVGLHKKKLYLKFANDVQSIGEKIKSFIARQTKKGKTVYVYGASTRGNTLLQFFKLNNELIRKAVERNPEKWGTKISSIDVPIVSEKEARRDKPDYMLVLPWFFKEEFLKRERNYLKHGGHFIFPLPQFEVV